MQDICAITLDLDDTLWAIAPVIRRAESELWGWLSENYPAIPQNFTSDDLLDIRRKVAEQHVNRSHDLRFLRKMVLQEVAIACGYGTELVDPAFDVFDAARNTVDFYPDVMPAMVELVEEFRVVAVTNGNANLEIIGIRHLFHDVVTAVDAGSPKPEKAIFDEAVRRTGVSRAEVLHVGDHPEFDVDGARNAGMRAAWMNRRGDSWPDHLPPPDAEITGIDELLQLLRPGHPRNRGRG